MIYLDHHATTPCAPEVLEAMWPYFAERYANAASTTHLAGREAARAVAEARAEVASLIGASPREIVFTSGATEALNLALLGLVAARGQAPAHVVTTAIEHPAVLDPCRALEARGVRVTRLPVGADGVLDPADVAAALTPDTVAVAVMAANNEIGTVQPIDAVGALCAEAGVPFVCDAVQLAGKAPLDVGASRVALLALSAHKLYGPKGVGALYVRRRPPIRLEAQIHGGGHERGLRAGTLNVPGAVGFGVACRLAAARMAEDGPRLRALRDRLLAGLRAGVDGVHVNGSLEARLAHNLHVSFERVEARRLLDALDGVALSTGSACASADLEPSHVLRALGVPEARLFASVRFGLGRGNTEAEIDEVVTRIVAAVRRLRA